jgi:ABC-type sulfate transport system permease component
MLRRRRAAYVVINDNGEPVMPPAIYAALESDADAALGLSVMLLLISFVLLVLFRRWLRSASEGI